MTTPEFHYPHQFSRAQLYKREPLFDVEEEYRDMLQLSRQMPRGMSYGCKFNDITLKLELHVNGEKAWQLAALEIKRMMR